MDEQSAQNRNQQVIDILRRENELLTDALEKWKQTEAHPKVDVAEELDRRHYVMHRDHTGTQGEEPLPLDEVKHKEDGEEIVVGNTIAEQVKEINQLKQKLESDTHEFTKREEDFMNRIKDLEAEKVKQNEESSQRIKKVEQMYKQKKSQVPLAENQLEEAQQQSSQPLSAIVEETSLINSEQLQEVIRELEETEAKLSDQNELLIQTQDELSHLRQKYGQLQVEVRAVQELRTTSVQTEDDKILFSRVSRVDLEAKIEDLSAQVNEWKSHCDNVQSQLDGVPIGLESVPGEKEALINHLEQQLTLVLKENGKLQDDIKELEQKLDNDKMERDNLSKQNLELFAVKNTYKEKLSEMDYLRSQVAVKRDTTIFLADQMAAKATEVCYLKEEKEALQKELDDLRGELVARRLQADYYKEDFKKERQDRENVMAGRIDDEKAELNLKFQVLVENVESANKQLDRVREKNTTLEVEKANLEAELTEHEKKVSEMEKSIRGYADQLTCHEQSKLDVTEELEEERQSKEQLENKVAKYQEQTDLAAVEKLSLQEQLNEVGAIYKLKVKQLYVMAAEKSNIEDLVSQLNARYNASQLELTDCRKQLKTAITDISRLSDEVLAKTQQVKEYKKQTESYKVTLDNTAYRLENTQTELQKKVKDLKTTKIKADQMLHRLDHELKKTLAQVPKSIRSNPPINLEALAVRPDRPMRFDNPIGKGSYGSVYQVELNGQRCIAKRLHDILIGRPGTEQVSDLEKDRIHEKFVRECILLSQMKHDNIVWFMGVVIDHQDKYNLTLLMEQLSTDLHEYLSNKQNKLPLSTKVSILHDISCGLLHLHQQSIIHRDLSAANVLLRITIGRPVQAKIADLGMSKFVDCNHLLTEAPGTLAYMSPESLLSQQYNDSLDIFSFGVICLFAAIQEFPVVSHEHVSDEIHRRGEGELFKRRKLIGMMYSKQPELSPLVLWCLQYDAMKRPSTFCLNIILEEMRKDN